MASYFLSDIHLKGSGDPNYPILLRFLNTEKVLNANYLVLLGDIFDLWIGKHDFFANQYPDFIHRIKELCEQGVQVIYFEGNHDLYLKDFWQNLGVQIEDKILHIEIEGHKMRLEHGDLANPDDKGYLFLRWLLRTPALKLLEKNLPAAVIQWIGENASKKSRKYTSSLKWDAREVIRSYVEREAQKENFDVMITGHLHVKDEYGFQLGNRSVLSINLGSWHDSAKALQVTNDDLEFLELK